MHSSASRHGSDERRRGILVTPVDAHSGAFPCLAVAMRDRTRIAKQLKPQLQSYVKFRILLTRHGRCVILAIESFTRDVDAIR